MEAAAETADNASEASGYPFVNSRGEWRNVPEQYGASLFEEALRIFLKDIGFSKE